MLTVRRSIQRETRKVRRVRGSAKYADAPIDSRGRSADDEPPGEATMPAGSHLATAVRRADRDHRDGVERACTADATARPSSRFSREQTAPGAPRALRAAYGSGP